jgi:large subunit ribosomal protein L10
MAKDVREKKEHQVDEIADKLQRSNLAILTDYRGLKVSDLNNLRGRLRPVGTEFHVSKNTLTRFAAQRVGREAIVADLEGPTGIAFVFDDPSLAAKALQDFVRVNRVMTIKAGILGDRRLDAEEVLRVAELPPRAQLQARLVGTVMSPMASLVGVMNGLLSNLAYVVNERAKQLGGGEEPAAAS